MAVGAAIGGTQGDTPEERIVYALGGMIGMGFAGKLVGAFRKDPKIAPILDATNPKMPGTSAPVDVLDPVQRVIKASTPPAATETVNKILRLDPTVQLTIEELRQGKQVEMSTWARLKEIADNMVDGEIYPEGELKNTLAFGRTLHDNINNAGQRLGATGGKGMERVKIKMGQIKQLATDWDPATGERELALAIKASGSIEKVGDFTRLYYAIPESVTQALYGAMLTGKSLVKNAVGNAPIVPIAIWDRSLASLKFWDPNKPMLSEAPMGVIAMWEGALDQIRILKDWRNAWDKLGEQAHDLGATHVEVSPRGFEALADISNDVGAGSLAKGFDFMNSAANLGPGIMARTDGMFKAINGRIATQWEAMQKAQAEGLQGGDYWNRVGSLVSDYSQLDPAALVRIKQFQDHQTFTTPFQSRIMSALQTGPEDPWLNLAYRMTVLPFVRTPMRLAEIGAEYTPGLNLAAANFYKSWQEGGTSRGVAQARLATGSIIIGSFMWLGMQGTITGNMPAHPADVPLEHGGRPKQSFWDPLAEKWRSYAGMEPLSTWISTGADLAYLVGQLPEYSAEKLLTAASVAISHNIAVSQFLTGISNLTDIMKAGSTDSQWEKAGDVIRKDLEGFIPAAGREIFGGAERKHTMKTGAFDEQAGASGLLHRELRALMDDYARSLSLYDEDTKTIKTMRNMFTGDKLTNDTWPFNPFTTKPDQPAPWAAEIRRLDGAGLKPLPDFIGGNPSPGLGLKDQPGVPGVRLTAPEKDRLEVLMTQVVQNSHGYLTEALDNLVQSPLYQRQTEYDKKTLIQGTWTEFRQRAEMRLEKEFKDLGDAIQLKKGTTLIERHVVPEKQASAKERLKLKFGPGVAP